MDASQEITALGLCNFIGSFIGSMPVTASFGRSAINSSSGVRTPFGGCITGLIILAGEKIDFKITYTYIRSDTMKPTLFGIQI